MVILASNVVTLTDWAKRWDASAQRIATIIELLAQMNEILPDILWKEGNLPTGDRNTVRTGLPAVVWRQLNQGVTPSKSTTVQVDNVCGSLEAWSEIDAELAELEGNPNEFRLSESMAFMEALNQAHAQALFYGDTSINPERFLGLAPRYSTIANAPSGKNVLDGGGTSSNNTSIWLVTWSPLTTHCIFPKGSKAGLVHEPLGRQVIETVAGVGGARMMGYRDRYVWKAGLNVRDWRYNCRIANIDVTKLVAESAAADLIKLMIRAIHHMPSLGVGKPVFYCNRTVREFLDIQALEKATYQLKIDDVAGHLTTSFRGIPIRTCDQILETEAQVV